MVLPPNSTSVTASDEATSNAPQEPRKKKQKKTGTLADLTKANDERNRKLVDVCSTLSDLISQHTDMIDLVPTKTILITHATNCSTAMTTIIPDLQALAERNKKDFNLLISRHTHMIRQVKVLEVKMAIQIILDLFKVAPITLNAIMMGPIPADHAFSGKTAVSLLISDQFNLTEKSQYAKNFMSVMSLDTKSRQQSTVLDDICNGKEQTEFKKIWNDHLLAPSISSFVAKRTIECHTIRMLLGKTPCYCYPILFPYNLSNNTHSIDS
jgi:hypothetical protein